MSADFDPFVGIYFAIGESIFLLPDSFVNISNERIVKIEKIGIDQYLVNLTIIPSSSSPISPTSPFYGRFLFTKVNDQLISFSAGNGIDLILYENGKLVYIFNAKSNTSDNPVRAGKFVLKPYN